MQVTDCSPRGFPLINTIISQRRPLFKENLRSTKGKKPPQAEKEVFMRNKMIMVLYTIASFLDDFAYFVIGRGEIETEREIKTLWGTHTYCD